jgi:hypothetical protein
MSEQEKAKEEEVLSQEVSEEEQAAVEGDQKKTVDWCYLLPDYVPHPCWNNSVRGEEAEEK